MFVLWLRLSALGGNLSAQSSSFICPSTKKVWQRSGLACWQALSRAFSPSLVRNNLTRKDILHISRVSSVQLPG
ncbi:hypothetical protein F5J12DRAFT_868792 [Pisolithus orientalis]|uniref:uncharacterized protein n=1 Tax=Pisolithus orientalis TaxID=936130 RepID=UPI002224F563|nr:uncharacterized protein F5J12DRAFT_868792 [Pisolithus orientalis]KAI5986033.1 hypothetical protein F5J12DRAFT_868792 [Pisolithus orientalis]